MIGPSDNAASVFHKTPQNKILHINYPPMIHRTPQTYGKQPVSTTSTSFSKQSISGHTHLVQWIQQVFQNSTTSWRNDGKDTRFTIINFPYSAGQNRCGNCLNPPEWNLRGFNSQCRLGRQTLQSIPYNLTQVNPQEVNNNYQTPQDRMDFKFEPTRTPEIKIRNMSNTSAIDSTTASSVDIHSELITISTSKFKQCDYTRFEMDWGKG